MRLGAWIAIIGTILSVGAAAHAMDLCALAIGGNYSEQIDPEFHFEQIENTHNETMDIIQRHYLRDEAAEKLRQGLDRINHGIDHLLDAYVDAEEWTVALHKKLVGLAREALHLKDHANLLVLRAKADRYEDIEKEPLLTRPNYSYLVETDPQLFQIEFSQSIVEKVLWYKNSDEEKRARAFIKAVKKGRHGGIKTLQGHKDVQELRLVCKHYGNCRIAGYTRGNTFFATVFMESHNRPKDLASAAELVQKAAHQK